jgi:hypothetical protein
MEIGNGLHPQISLNPDEAIFQNPPWPMHVDVYIQRFITNWRRQHVSKNQQIPVLARTPIEAIWRELRRKDRK